MPQYFGSIIFFVCPKSPIYELLYSNCPLSTDTLNDIEELFTPIFKCFNRLVNIG